MILINHQSCGSNHLTGGEGSQDCTVGGWQVVTYDTTTVHQEGYKEKMGYRSWTGLCLLRWIEVSEVYRKSTHRSVPVLWLPPPSRIPTWGNQDPTTPGRESSLIIVCCGNGQLESHWPRSHSCYTYLKCTTWVKKKINENTRERTCPHRPSC